MFGELVSGIREEAVEIVFKLQPAKQVQAFRGVFAEVPHQQMLHPEMATFEAGPQRALPEDAAAKPQETPRPIVRADHEKVGRNDPCPCGSGKKYKKCCGK